MIIGDTNEFILNKNIYFISEISEFFFIGGGAELHYFVKSFKCMYICWVFLFENSDNIVV